MDNTGSITIRHTDVKRRSNFWTSNYMFRFKILIFIFIWLYSACLWPHIKKMFVFIKKGKGRYSSSWEPHLRATGRHLPYGITRCYLPPNTGEHAPPNPSHAGWYSIYLPQRDGRLSWPSWLDSAPARSRTSDLSITSPTLNHCTTKTTLWQINVHISVSNLALIIKIIS